jgi:hypothetical protein
MCLDTSCGMGAYEISGSVTRRRVVSFMVAVDAEKTVQCLNFKVLGSKVKGGGWRNLKSGNVLRRRKERVLLRQTHQLKVVVVHRLSNVTSNERSRKTFVALQKQGCLPIFVVV